MPEIIHPQGNPQGKGLVMVLPQMAESEPADIRAQSADEALLDCWCSRLVVSAAFKFLVGAGNL